MTTTFHQHEDEDGEGLGEHMAEAGQRIKEALTGKSEPHASSDDATRTEDEHTDERPAGAAKILPPAEAVSTKGQPPSDIGLRGPRDMEPAPESPLTNWSEDAAAGQPLSRADIEQIVDDRVRHYLGNLSGFSKRGGVGGFIPPDMQYKEGA